ncbi:unnamed protein product [Prunus brigantina]
MAIASKMRLRGDKIDVTIIEKIMHSMSPKFNYVVCAIEEANEEEAEVLMSPMAEEIMIPATEEIMIPATKAKIDTDTKAIMSHSSTNQILSAIGVVGMVTAVLNAALT